MSNTPPLYLATRTDAQNLDQCVAWVTSIQDSFERCYILNDAKEFIEGKIVYKTHPTPVQPSSLNIALRELPAHEQFFLLIASREVRLTTDYIAKLKQALLSDPTLLVVGCTFRVVVDRDEELSSQLDDELQTYYKEQGIAYRVPWNTCAMWNFELFKKNVGEFEKAFDVAEGAPKGMEDGLAIAKAASADVAIRYKLLDDKIEWLVDKTRIARHREKMHRKNNSLSAFIKRSGFSEEKLRKAKV